MGNQSVPLYKPGNKASTTICNVLKKFSKKYSGVVKTSNRYIKQVGQGKQQKRCGSCEDKPQKKKTASDITKNLPKAGVKVTQSTL